MYIYERVPWGRCPGIYGSLRAFHCDAVCVCVCVCGFVKLARDYAPRGYNACGDLKNTGLARKYSRLLS